jgi:Zn-dependent protease
MSFQVVNVAVQLAAVFLAISLHESAHAWTALQFGDPTARDQGRISLNPLHHIDPFGTVVLPLLLALFHQPIFGYAKPTPVNLRNTRNPRSANFWVSAAGPGSNLIAGGASLVVLMAIGRLSPRTILALLSGTLPGGILAPVAYLLLQFVLINLILAVFNLIPIPPMDGSGILFSLLGRRGLKLELFFHRNALLMFVVILALVYGGLFSIVLTPVIRAVLRVIQWSVL